MTPKEQAYELFIRLYNAIPSNPDNDNLDYNAAKHCALITVNFIILSNPHSNPLNSINTHIYSTMDYWMEVKKEIEQL